MPNPPKKVGKKKSRKVSKNPTRQMMAAENTASTGDFRIPNSFAKIVRMNQVYRLVRYAIGNDIAQVALAETKTSAYFALSSLPSYTELTSLFEEFRIACVKIVARPRFNFAAVTGATDIYPQLVSVLDYTDASALASVDAARQYTTFKETRFDQDHVRIIQPKFAVAAYTGTFTAYSPKNGWVATTGSGVQWYAIKWAIEAGAAGQTNLQKWSINYEYFLEFRNVS